MHMCDESCLQEERHGKHTTLSGWARAGGAGNVSKKPTTPPAAHSLRTAPSLNVSLCTQGLDVTWSLRALQLIFTKKKIYSLLEGAVSFT